MKFVFLFFLNLLMLMAFSQEKTFKYYNSKDSIVSKEKASRYTIEYFDPKANRIYKEFYNLPADEITERAYFYNDSIRDGLMIKYLENRQVWDSGYMKMGHRTGITYFYHHNGEPASIIDFKEDTSLFIHCYDEYGIEIPCDEKMEKMPVFPGGTEGLMKYLSIFVKYPVKARDNDIKGKVVVKFYIDYNGSVKDPVVIRSVDPLLDAEALRVIAAMPDWKPGIQFNRKVKVYYTLPITFDLK